MEKNPLEHLANRIGLFAYLAAVGGLQHWPTARQAVIEERTMTAPSPLIEATKYEREAREEKVPA